MTIKDLFEIENSNSKGFSAHEAGNVPFVSNGFYNNGVKGFVKPFPGEKVIDKKAVCVSSFCEATVQNAPFIPRGNGGSGLVVLLPKRKLEDNEYYYYASLINVQSWRFSYGRMVIKPRLSKLKLQKFDNIHLTKQKPESFLPKQPKNKNVEIRHIRSIKLTRLFNIKRKYAPYMNKVDVSKRITPYVTTTENNNGISIYCNEKPNFSGNSTSVALDGKCGTSFYQFDNFISGEKTAVLTMLDNKDLKKYKPYILFYSAALLNTITWRYTYGLKLSIARLNDIRIPFPTNNEGVIDYETLKSLVKNSYGSTLFDKYV